jgi:hypothetical protein
LSFQLSGRSTYWRTSVQAGPGIKWDSKIYPTQKGLWVWLKWYSTDKWSWEFNP